jgi:hypothetical protein
MSSGNMATATTTGVYSSFYTKFTGAVNSLVYLDNYVSRRVKYDPISNITPVNDYYYITVTNNGPSNLTNTTALITFDKNYYFNESLGISELGSINFNSANQSPNNVQYSSNVVNMSIVATSALYGNASLYIDGTYNISTILVPGTNYISFLKNMSNGNHSFTFLFNDTMGIFDNPTQYFFVDNETPKMNYTSESVNRVFRQNQNITAFINFTDVYNIYNWTVRIDNVIVANSTTPFNQTYGNYSMNRALTNYAVGRHFINISASDGFNVYGGSLNSNSAQFMFYVYNTTNTDTNTTVAGAAYNEYLTFYKGTEDYQIVNVSRWYNATHYRNMTLLQYDNIQHTEMWNLTYITIGDLSPVNYAIRTNFSVTGLGVSPIYAMLNYTQFNIPLGIGNCTSGTSMNGTRVLNFTFWKEESPLVRLNGTLNIYLNTTTLFGLSANVGYNFSFTGGNTYSICIYPNASQLRTDAVMQYTAPGYQTRSYYLFNVTMSNVTQTINLYQLNTSISAYTTTNTYDLANGRYLPGSFVSMLRYYPQTNSYSVVEVEQSDSNGNAIFSVVPYNTFYKFLVTYNGKTYIPSQYGFGSTISAGTLPLPIFISNQLLTTLAGIYNVGGKVTCNKTSVTCSFTWNDYNGLVQTGLLQVFRVNGWGKTLIFNNTLDAPAGSLVYTITEDYNGSTYLALGSIETTTTNSFSFIDQDSINPNLQGDLGDSKTVIYAGFMLLLTLSLLLIDFGPKGIAIGIVLALGAGALLGMIPLTLAGIITLVAIFIIGLMYSKELT